MATTKANDKKAMDITQPGKTAPDNTARPVLVTHRPMVQDPMVNQSLPADEDGTPEPKKEPTTHTAKLIQPVDDSLKPADTADETKNEEVAEEKPSETKTESSDTAVVDAVAEQAESDAKKKTGDPGPEEKAQKEKIQKLIDEKTYFVPTGQVARRRNRRLSILLLVLLLLIVGGYLAIDAKLILSNIKLPVELIKN